MNSPIPWMGGKRRLAKKIIPMFPEHACYVEPFAGGASLLFMRDYPAKVEVLNDLNGDLVNFFRVLKHHLVEFCNQFRWAVTSRQMFEWLNATPPETLTDIQRAARFFYLQKLAFGSRNVGRTFGTTTTTRPKLNLVRLEEDMSATHERLAHVAIEHLPWADCVRRYDRPHTLFYLDPPYWQTAGYDGPSFDLPDPQRPRDSHHQRPPRYAPGFRALPDRPPGHHIHRRLLQEPAVSPRATGPKLAPVGRRQPCLEITVKYPEIPCLKMTVKKSKNDRRATRL